MSDLVCKIGYSTAQTRRGRVGMRDSQHEVKSQLFRFWRLDSSRERGTASILRSVSIIINRRNCERWKKGLVEPQHVILAHSICLLTLAPGDIRSPGVVHAQTSVTTRSKPVLAGHLPRLAQLSFAKEIPQQETYTSHPST